MLINTNTLSTVSHNISLVTPAIVVQRQCGTNCCLMNEVSASTHLESNSEHQHSKDKGPKRPVPKHLQGRDRKMSDKHRNCTTSCGSFCCCQLSCWRLRLTRVLLRCSMSPESLKGSFSCCRCCLTLFVWGSVKQFSKVSRHSWSKTDLANLNAMNGASVCFTKIF